MRTFSAHLYSLDTITFPYFSFNFRSKAHPLKSLCYSRTNVVSRAFYTSIKLNCLALQFIPKLRRLQSKRFRHLDLFQDLRRSIWCQRGALHLFPRLLNVGRSSLLQIVSGGRGELVLMRNILELLFCIARGF